MFESEAEAADMARSTQAEGDWGVVSTASDTDAVMLDERRRKPLKRGSGGAGTLPLETPVSSHPQIVASRPRRRDLEGRG